MDNLSWQDVKKCWALTSLYFQQTLPDIVLVEYVKDVMDDPTLGLTPGHVMHALTRLRKEKGRRSCPTPGDVIAFCRPEENDQDKASLIAASIFKAVGDYGYNNAVKAQKALGPTAWNVTQAMGGWAALCASLTVENRGTFHAQAKHVAIACLAREKVSHHPALDAHINHVLSA